jgi:hypothetical protein
MTPTPAQKIIMKIPTLLLPASFVFLFVGCGSTPEPPPKPVAGEKPVGHHHAAPHGGTLIELGEEYAHVELVLDKGSGKLSAFVLNGHLDEAVRLAQPTMEITVEKPELKLNLVAIPSGLSGETVGDTSQFETQSDALKGVSEFKAAISAVTVKGQDFKNIRFDFPKGNDEDAGK